MAGVDGSEAGEGFDTFHGGWGGGRGGGGSRNTGVDFHSSSGSEMLRDRLCSSTSSRSRRTTLCVRYGVESSSAVYWPDE